MKTEIAELDKQVAILTDMYCEQTESLFQVDRRRARTAFYALINTYHMRPRSKFRFEDLRRSFEKMLPMDAPEPETKFECAAAGFLIALDAILEVESDG